MNISDERLRELAEGNFQTRFTGWEVQQISDELIAARAEVDSLREQLKPQNRLEKYKSYIEFKDISAYSKDVIFKENNVKIGECHMEVDGVWYYWDTPDTGYTPDYILIAIGLKLLELNHPNERI